MRVGDTIAAIATAPGRGGIGIVRVSGPLSKTIAQAVTGKALRARHATLATLIDASGEALDQGVAIVFEMPRSFTGEDVLELHGHGGSAVLDLLLKRCVELGARLARPGEFTERAFLNEKLDLAQAESVADLIDAATAQAAKSALRSLRGELSGAVRALVADLINLRMLVEATLDFPEEEIDFLAAADARGKLAAISSNLNRLRGQAQQGRLLREGLRVVLAGAPNVGKSSLLNRLAGEEVAIVTAVAGTTRDAIRQDIAIDGVVLTIIDTAGLRDSVDEVEKIGIARSWDALRDADLALVISDASLSTSPADDLFADLPNAIPRLDVRNKIDLVDASAGCDPVTGVCAISAKTGAGIDALKIALLRLAGWQEHGENVFMARTRHVDALDQAIRQVAAAEAAWPQLEFFAEELRQAQQTLGTITGEFSADDLLGEIFSRFCIGK